MKYVKSAILRFPLSIYLHRHFAKQGQLYSRLCIDILMCLPALVFCALLIAFVHARNLFTGTLSSNRPIDLAIVAIIKNEAQYIDEWIKYHHSLGVSHFFIYDNDSSDNVIDVVRDYIDCGLVTYNTVAGRNCQIDAYNDALNKYGSLCKYIAFLDLDEFIYPRQSTSLVPLLDRKFADSKAAALVINWCIFGSSNRKHRSKGWVTETYLYRSRDEFDKNRHVKAICRPSYTLGFLNPHNPIGIPGYYSIDMNGRRMDSAESMNVLTNEIRINHYFTKSEDEFRQKRARGKADSLQSRDEEEFNVHDRNDVYDDSILSLTQKLH